MQTFVLALCVLVLITAAMSIGVLLGRRPISGSCGGVGAALGQENHRCEFCGGDLSKCETVASGDAVVRSVRVWEFKQD